MGSFAIETEKFKGPIELLLDLVEKRKMHISDISLAEVADKFVEYTESLLQLPVADTANFIYVASILLLIKSKALLPGIELEKEEEASIEELERRLAIFKLLKDEAEELSRILGKNIIYAPLEREPLTIFAPPLRLTVAPLWEAMMQILQAIPREEALEQRVVEKVVSLEEMIVNLHDRMQRTLRASFREFSRGKKVETIVSFLAMLELVRRGILEVRQRAHGSDIEMEAVKVRVPTY